MKKRLVFTVSIILVVCLCLTAFSGCFAVLHLVKDFREDFGTDDRHRTLEIASVEQWLTGTLVLRLKSTWFVEQSDRLEITFDGGKSWENIDERKLDSCYYENIEDRHIGKHKIAIRIAADEEKAQDKKSNIVKFNVKKPSEFYQYMIQGDILDIGELELGQYAFELQDDAIRLKKCDIDGNNNLQLRELTDGDKMNFEYKIVDSQLAMEEYQDEGFADTLEDMLSDMDIKIVGEDGLQKVSRTLAMFLYSSSLQYDEDENAMSGWNDYDFQKGILKTEYEKGVSCYLSIDDVNKEIDIEGEMVWILIRTKEDKNTLKSHAALTYALLS